MSIAARVTHAIVIAAMAFAITKASASDTPPLCALKLTVHKDGSVAFDGKTYAVGDELKTTLIDYHVHHANCTMNNVAMETGTSMKVAGETILFLAESGLLPDKAGFLIEPRDAP